MTALNSKMAQLEKLLERAAEASGKKSTDIVPTNVKNLVAEMNEDEGEALLGDMTIDVLPLLLLPLLLLPLLLPLLLLLLLLLLVVVSESVSL